MNARLSTRRLVTLGCLDGVALARFAPDWWLLEHHLRSPHDWLAGSGLDGAAATLAGAALWCVGAWLAVGLLATVFALLPGQLGAAGSSFAERLLPSVVLRAVAGAAGLSVLLAPVAAGAKTAPAAAPPSRPGTQQSAPAPVWPIDTARPIPSAGRPDLPATPRSRPCRRVRHRRSQARRPARRALHRTPVPSSCGPATRFGSSPHTASHPAPVRAGSPPSGPGGTRRTAALSVPIRRSSGPARCCTRRPRRPRNRPTDLQVTAAERKARP